MDYQQLLENNPGYADSVQNMPDFKYEIVKEIGVLSENAKGWRKELNKIS